MPSFDPIEFVLDSDDGLSNAMGTETLAALDSAVVLTSGPKPGRALNGPGQAFGSYPDPF
jgi:hypothetical protein